MLGTLEMDVEMLLHTFPIIRNMETWRQRVCWAKRKPQSKWYLNSKIWDQRNWHAGMGQIWWTSHLVDVSCHFCMKHPIFGSSAVFSPRTFASCPANRNAHNWWSANTLMRACLAWELSWGEPLVHVEVQRAKAKAFWCCWMLPASKCAMPLTIRRRNRSRVSSSRFQRDWLTGFMVYLVGITHHSCFFLPSKIFGDIIIDIYVFSRTGRACMNGGPPWAFGFPPSFPGLLQVTKPGSFLFLQSS